MQFSYFGRNLFSIKATNKYFSAIRHWKTTKLKTNIYLYSKMYSTEPTLNLNQLISSYVKDCRQKNVELLLEPCKYLWSIPCLNINDELIDSLNIWMKIPQDKVKIIKEVTLLYYNSLILLDDILDNSPTRKGAPSPHKIFGVGRTLLAAEALIVQALQKMSTTNNPKAFQNLANKMTEYHAAIALQVYQKNNLITKTKEDYFHLCSGVDVGYYSSMSVMMQAFSDCEIDFTRLMTIFGFYTRVLNDYSNIDRKEFMNIKEFGEDISQGIHTFPVVLATERKRLESDIILNIVNLKSNDEVLKNYCIDLMEKLGTIEESKDWEAYLYQMLINEINKLGGNPSLVTVADKFLKWKNDELFSTHTLSETMKKDMKPMK